MMDARYQDQKADIILKYDGGVLLVPRVAALRHMSDLNLARPLTLCRLTVFVRIVQMRPGRSNHMASCPRPSRSTQAQRC